MPRAKDILVCLWGGLGQKNTVTLHVNENNNKIQTIEPDRTILNIRPTNEEDTIIEFAKNNEYYVSNHARVACFVLSNGRFLISNTIRPHVHLVMRCHTDSMMTTEALPITTGNDLGDIKYEGKCPHVEIYNIRKTWDDKKDFKL